MHTDLAQGLQESWDEFAGIRPTRVRVVSGEGAIVVWLEEVLPPAERRMDGTQEGSKMLQEFEVRILEQARPQLQRLAESATGQARKRWSESISMCTTEVFWGSSSSAVPGGVVLRSARDRWQWHPVNARRRTA